ncbi:acyltransferase family protein, partial [Ralstonia pseudosolanacearum]|uniref:acyltransferase family protein n=1 Tax=Ralstonia pseudosolanacearum TaxID=1310165 RepID=UPI001E29FFF0
MPWIDAARVISIFAVVFLHISASVVTEADFGSSFWWHGNFYDSMVRWCVPVFVMISGSAAAGRKQGGGCRHLLQKASRENIAAPDILDDRFPVLECDQG